MLKIIFYFCYDCYDILNVKIFFVWRIVKGMLGKIDYVGVLFDKLYVW